MKKLLITFLIITSLQSCKKPQNDYVTLSGKIENPSSTFLAIMSSSFTKYIDIQSDGTFKDTLKIDNDGYFTLRLNNDHKSFLFLRNGFDLNLTANGDNFAKNVKYTGFGSSTNNYLIAKYAYEKSLGSVKKYFTLDRNRFDEKMQKFKSGFDSIRSLFKNIDTAIVRSSNQQNKKYFDILKKIYNQQHGNTTGSLNESKSLSKGSPSPKFINYENFKGGKTSLNTFKGEYVYIDVWATWCRPCLREIPALKDLEKKYHKKNIQFVSISIDDKRTAGSWKNANAKWRKMVADKNLTGVQLYAGQDLQFIREYQISSIPRFILIDPNGNIVNSNAPRPSNPQLINLFNELGI